MRRFITPFLSTSSPVIWTLFFLSGAAGLIYEISWSRQIGLLFGHTAQAASIVLSSYFSGMAIGYWLGSRCSGRIAPLTGYAIAELAVAIWAVVIPVLLEVSETESFATWLSSTSAIWQTCTRSIFCFLLLLPATIALGITLPMMANHFSKGSDGVVRDRDVSSRISLAYALNTAGALTGVLLATFWLILFVGVRSSSYIAALISTACALGAIIVQRRETRVQRLDQSKVVCQESGDLPSEIRSSTFDPHPSTITPQLLTLAFLSGFGTLALQVLYTRMFSLVFHNSTYTFGIVVAVFLASLSGGAALASQLQKWFAGQILVGFAATAGAVATSASTIFFVWLTELKYFSYGDSFTTYMIGAIGIVSLVVAPPVICLGMLLPLVWKLAGLANNAGAIVGKLTAVNTIAAATGALIASFVLLTWPGLWQSIVLIAFLFFIAGFWILWIENRVKSAVLFGIVLCIVAAFSISSPTESEFDRIEYGERMIHRWTSAYGWIDLVQRTETGAFKIRQNLHYRFGTTGDNAREYRQAHIPLLLYENPQDVLFMGLGTGLTAGGAIPHPEVKSIVAVELIPEVVKAARVLSDYNYNVVDNPKVKIRIDDARHYLLAHGQKYDVIVSDLFVPWESETGYLYTVEHYQVAARRLKSNGLFCQWLPLYQLGEGEFKLIADSFASVFPHSTIWWGQLETTSPVIALIGTSSPINFDDDRIADRLRKLQEQATTIDPTIATPDRIADLYIGDWILRPSAILNTDEHPRVEFLTPISNRNQRMIRGEALELFVENVFSLLPGNSVYFHGNKFQTPPESRRARQRAVLFGK